MAHPLRILYVEDQIDIQVVAQLALETIGGFILKICSSGKEALEVAEAFEPNVLLLDVVMPDMDGPTTLESLRNMPKLKALPVAFMTAKTEPEEVATLLALGARTIIPKPFDPMRLADQVSAIFKDVIDA